MQGLGAQISQRPNFLGTKKVKGPNEIGDHFSYSPEIKCTAHIALSNRPKILFKLDQAL